MAYEAEVNRVFPQHRMIGLCTYLLDGCPADAVLEVIRNHHFALARSAGEWEIIENSSSKMGTLVSEQLQQLSADVLEQQDDERRWIANQLHEVTAQNVSAIAIYLANLKQESSWPSTVEFLLAKCHTLCEQSLEQILTLSRGLHPPILDELGLAACLRAYVDDFTKRSRIQVEFETDAEIGRLPRQVETHLFRVAQEGLSNIVLHSGSRNAIVRLHKQSGRVILQIEDFGGSGDERNSGLGILGMQERLRKIGGRLEIRFNNQGTLLTASIRL
jgi:two-component system sensor histidine kinase UhpB